MKLLLPILFFLCTQTSFACSYERDRYLFLTKNPEVAALAAIVKIEKIKGKRYLVVEKAWTSHLKTYPLSDDTTCKLGATVAGKKYLWLSDVTTKEASSADFEGFSKSTGIMLEINDVPDTIKKLEKHRLK